MWPLFWPGVGFVAAVLVALLLRSALKRALRRRLRAEGIEIPFPVRTIEHRPPRA